MVHALSSCLLIAFVPSTSGADACLCYLFLSLEVIVNLNFAVDAYCGFVVVPKSCQEIFYITCMQLLLCTSDLVDLESISLLFIGNYRIVGDQFSVITGMKMKCIIR